MPISLNLLSEEAISHNTKIKIYPDGSTNTTYCKRAIFKEQGYEIREKQKGDIIDEIHLTERECDDLADSRKVKRDRKEEIMRRTKDMVRDIVLMNDFKYFLTITINPEQLDSFDVNEVKKKLRNWLNNMQKRKGLQYILIPEYHKSGRIHCHALVNDVFKLVDSGKRDKDKIIYNVPEWKYGFTTAIPLDDNKFRVANYVTKYITKGSDKIFGKYYWSSKNIQREPEIILTDTPYEEVQSEEFKPLKYNDDLAFKYSNCFQYNSDGQSQNTATVVYTHPDGTTEEMSIADVCRLMAKGGAE